VIRTWKSARRMICLASPLVLVTACVSASAHEAYPSHHHTATASTPAAVDTTSMPGMTMPAQGVTGTPSGTASSTAAATVPGIVTVTGTPVANLIENAEPPEKSEYCAQSTLPPGEGLANKGGTCVSTPLGEIAKHPVRVSVRVPPVNRVGKSIKFRILVADNLGPLDLNAFTHDANNKAGVTLLEFPGKLQANGRPFLHCHLGVAKVDRNGLPGELYDGAFSGVQGFKGAGLVATVKGLPRGTYRADVYCSEPGHPMLPTALANMVQAFDTANVIVVGRNGR
jgi:hypothetical protein